MKIREVKYEYVGTGVAAYAAGMISLAIICAIKFFRGSVGGKVVDVLTRRCLNCNSVFEAEVAAGCFHIHLLGARGEWASPEVHCTDLMCPNCHSTCSEEKFLDEIEED